MRVHRRLHVPRDLPLRGVTVLARALTDEQEHAVGRRRESLLLAAGAGSGKTAVLVERVVRAVLDDRIDPGRILAITFTDRAAAELRERVRARLVGLGETDAARALDAAPMGTFHGFCARLLRDHADGAGLHPDFTILDDSVSRRLRERAFRRALGDALTSEMVELLAAVGADRVRSTVLGVHAELRSRGHSHPALPTVTLGPDATADDVRGAQACALLGVLLERFADAYADSKRRRRALDFDDLELLARRLLEEHDDVRAEWRERLELLMVDELQDTNPRQLAILALLERENLFTVGDELQAIYGFRHADVGLFRARRDELARRGASLALVRNFRSRAPLLDAVNAVFAARLGDAFTPLLAARADAHDATAEPPVELLLTDRRGWGERDSELCAEIAAGLPPAPCWRQAEARLLAQRIADILAAGHARGGEVVVLLRGVGDLPVYERALQDRGLATLATVGSFWGHQQVADLLAHLRALANPLDEVALYSTLASPLVGLSSDALALLARAAASAGHGLWETIRRADLAAAEPAWAGLPGADRERLDAFRRRFDAERRVAHMLSVPELLQRAIAATGYDRHVRALARGGQRTANIHKLLDLAAAHEAADGRDLRGFLDHAAHQQQLQDSGSEPEAPAAEDEPDAVRLMSVHAAKGLEFPIVCLADLGRAPSAGVPDLLVDGPRIGLRLAQLDGSDSIPTLAYDELSAERRRAQADEEERIVYVAMTRARERLLLSGALDFERQPAPVPGGPPIAWLAPALVADLPAMLRTLEHPVSEPVVSGTGSVRVRCQLNAPSTVGTVLRRR